MAVGPQTRSRNSSLGPDNDRKDSKKENAGMGRKRQTERTLLLLEGHVIHLTHFSKVGGFYMLRGHLAYSHTTRGSRPHRDNPQAMHISRQYLELCDHRSAGVFILFLHFLCLSTIESSKSCKGRGEVGWEPPTTACSGRQSDHCPSGDT